MKRLLAVLLILTILITLGALIPGSADQFGQQPFYMVNVMGASSGDLPDNIAEMPKAVLAPIKKSDTEITVTMFDASDIPTMAQKLKEEFDSRPEGTRYLNFPLEIYQQAENIIYMDKTVALFKDWMQKFFTEYRKIDGKIDGMAFGTEYAAMNAVYIHSMYQKLTTIRGEMGGAPMMFAENKDIYNNIVNDSRYAAEVRPYLEERGFQFGTPNSERSEIYPISNASAPESSIWDAVMHDRMARYINEACAPFLELYPNAHASSYRFGSSSQWDENTKPDGTRYTGGNMIYAGNTANENFFLQRPSQQLYSTVTGYVTPTTYNKAVYEATAYNTFLYEVNTFKDMYAASDNKNVSAWIAGFNYLNGGERSETGLAYSPYYAETLYHIAMLNPQPFLGYIVAPRDTDTNDDPYNYNDVMRNLSDILTELTRVAGYVDRKAISVPRTWNSSFVLSGMYAGGRNIWRITPDLSDGKTLEQFVVKDQAPTFSIGGETVIFPQGRFIMDSQIYATGTCGYWIETPANVMPVFTADTNRYEAYPAYEENFDSYAQGTVFDYATARHLGGWIASGAAAAVEQHNGTMALALTGTAKIQNIKIPANITAGDSYAKQQVWQVTVTVPAAGEMTLLTCGEGDSGIRIADGKVYYDGSVELAKITAGRTYTISREVDFRTADAFTSTYTVRNANGAVVAQKKSVPMAQVSLPVKEIVSACTDVDKAYIDDYRLYAAGVTAELRLYEADTGMQIADISAARTEDTVYRLSWLNASGNYQVAKIYSNGTLLQTVQMPSGTDGCVTGLAAGGSQLTVTVENGTAPTLPDYDTGDFEWMPEDIIPPETIAPPELPPEETVSTEETTVPSVTEETLPVTQLPIAPIPTIPPAAEEKGLSGGRIALIVIGAVLVLAAGGFALLRFAIKPKWLMGLTLDKSLWQKLLAFVRSKCREILTFFKSWKK